MSHYRSSDKSGCLGGVIFWGTLFLVGTHEEHAIEILIGGSILLALYFLLSHYISNRCPHGVYKGTEWIDGKRKCPKCEEAMEQARQRVEERTEEIEQSNQEREEQKRVLSDEEEKKREILKQRRNDYSKSLFRATNVKKEYLLSCSSIINSLSPYEFEDYIAYLLRILGFTSIHQTPYQNDGGKDIICSYEGKTYYVECKHYKNDNKVSRPLLQKLFAAMTEDSVEKGLFFTSSTFTSSAIEYGKRYNIRTIDGDELAKIVASKIPQKEKPTYYSLPCPQCGKIVQFHYFENPTTRLCPDGHSVIGVPNDLRLFQNKRV